MDNDKTAIEILREFAKHSGRKVEFSEKAYPSVPLQPVTYHRRTLYIPNKLNETSYFLCFGDSKEFGDHATYSGVFIPVSLPSSTTIIVRKRDILDKLNPFKRQKSYKTGIQNFDSQVVITGHDPGRGGRIFNNRNIQDLVIKAFKLEEGLKIAVNEVNVEFVPGLKNKSHVGIFSTQEWLLDSSLIEKLFDLIEEFRKLINKKS